MIFKFLMMEMFKIKKIIPNYFILHTFIVIKCFIDVIVKQTRWNNSEAF